MNITLEFEYECYSCLGAGPYRPGGCDVCANTGRLPSGLGAQLIEFLEHQRQRDDRKSQPEQAE